MTWSDWLLLGLVFVVSVLAPPPFIYFSLFKPERLVARRGRAEQRHFYSAKWSGKRRTNEDIYAILGRSVSEYFLGAKYSDFVRYAADDPRRFPRAVVARRIAGDFVLLSWLFASSAFLCAAIAMLNRTTLMEGRLPAA